MVGGAYLPIGISAVVAGGITGVVLNGHPSVREHRGLVVGSAATLGGIETAAGLAALAVAVKSSSATAITRGQGWGVALLGIGVATLGLSAGYGAAQLTPLNA